MVKKLLIPLLLLCFSSASATEFLPEGTKKISLESDYDSIGYYYYYGKDSLCGLTDSLNHVLTPPVYTWIDLFLSSPRCFAVKKGQYVGLLDSLGNLLLPPKYSRICYDHWSLKDHLTFDLVDSLGIVDTFYCEEKRFSSAFSPYFLRRDESGKFCLVDVEGKQITGLFDYIKPFLKGKALAQKDSLVGYIGLDGNFTADPMLQNANLQYAGFNGYYVKRLGKRSFLDENYTLILPFEYDSLLLMNRENYFIAIKNQKYGVVASGNRVILPFEYDKFDFSVKNTLIVKSDNHYGVINAKKGVILPVVYDDIVRYERKTIEWRGKVVADSGRVWWNWWHYTTSNSNEDISYVATRGKEKVIFDCRWKPLHKLMVKNVESEMKLKYLGQEYYHMKLEDWQCVYSVTDRKIVYEDALYDDDYDYWYVYGKREKCGVVDSKWNVIVPVKYDDVEYDKDCDCFKAGDDRKDRVTVYSRKGERIRKEHPKKK